MSTNRASNNALTRRRFLSAAACTGIALAAGVPGLTSKAFAADIITVPALKYSPDALEPHVSGRTISFHYGKHHAGYARKANKFLPGSGMEKMSMEDIIKATAYNAQKSDIYNNVAQVWNHTFYWDGMKPGGGGKPSGKVLEALEGSFGGYDAFVARFKSAATGRFGSGYAWLVEKDGVLLCTDTANAGNPMADGMKPLLTIDVWEHAYYLDYQNRRGDYIDAFLKHLVNWDFVAENLG